MEQKATVFPKILLLGNGINRAFDADSWEDMLKAITERNDLPKELHLPMPLQAVLVSNDHLSKKLSDPENQKNWFGKLTKDGKQGQLLRQLLQIGFDDILTTNYSYELEAAALGYNSLTAAQVKKLAAHTPKVTRCESRYRLFTYNQLPDGNRVWHIHGETRIPDSMILGHYYYSDQVAKMKDYLTKYGSSYQQRQVPNQSQPLYSWLDSFILGNVYVLGFGFDVSELDLWWLLGRKKREKANHGKVYFYEPRREGFQEKDELLKLYDVELRDCGFQASGVDYKIFYKAAIEDIQRQNR